jgi:hypothetical protein
MKIVYEKVPSWAEPWPRDEIGFLEDGGEVIPPPRRRYGFFVPAVSEEVKKVDIGPKGVELKRRDPSNSARAVAHRELVAFVFAHPSWRGEGTLDAASTTRLNALYAAYKAARK